MAYRPVSRTHASFTQNIADERRRRGTKSEIELERILNELSDGKLRDKFQREWAFGGRWIVDFYFHELRLGIEVDGGYHAPIVQQLRDIERELAIEEMGITLVRVTNEEVFGDRDLLLEKLRDGWRRALAAIRKGPMQKRQRSIPPAPTRRRIAKPPSYSGGWTSIEQGATKLGDSYDKAFVSEGISGTRDEHRAMGKQQLSEIRKRSR